MEKFGTAMRMSAILYTPISIGLLIIAPEFIQAALGERWLPAVIPMQVLCVAAIFRAIGNQIMKLLLAMGRPDLDVWFQTGFLATLILCLIPFSLWFGIVGASLAVLIASVIWHFWVRVVALRRITGFGFERTGRVLLPAFAASTFMGVGILAAKTLSQATPTSFSFLVFQVTVGVILYGAWTFLFSRKDLNLMFRPAVRGAKT
jgi:O-antigen/teichoic acid export membrane protein